MFSIVTATMNLKLKELEPILATYDRYFEDGLSFELIVQDNGSDEAVLATMRERVYVNLLSATDTGIYDAWNKALTRVRGQWIGFLGIDDLPTHEWVSFVGSFAAPEIVSTLACDVSMEDADHIRVGVNKNPRSGSLDTKANAFAHPGLAIAAEVFVNRNFPDHYRVIGDLVFYTQFKDLAVVGHLGAIGVSMQLGGVSNSPKGARTVLKEYLRAVWQGDVPLHIPFVIRRVFAALLSVSPRLYLTFQRKRWNLTKE